MFGNYFMTTDRDLDYNRYIKISRCTILRVAQHNKHILNNMRKQQVIAVVLINKGKHCNIIILRHERYHLICLITESKV